MFFYETIERCFSCFPSLLFQGRPTMDTLSLQVPHFGDPRPRMTTSLNVHISSYLHVLKFTNQPNYSMVRSPAGARSPRAASRSPRAGPRHRSPVRAGGARACAWRWRGDGSGVGPPPNPRENGSVGGGYIYRVHRVHRASVAELPNRPAPYSSWNIPVDLQWVTLHEDWCLSYFLDLDVFFGDPL